MNRLQVSLLLLLALACSGCSEEDNQIRGIVLRSPNRTQSMLVHVEHSPADFSKGDQYRPVAKAAVTLSTTRSLEGSVINEPAFTDDNGRYLLSINRDLIQKYSGQRLYLVVIIENRIVLAQSTELPSRRIRQNSILIPADPQYSEP